MFPFRIFRCAAALLLLVVPAAAQARAGIGLGSVDRSFRIEKLDEGIYLGSAPRSRSDIARLKALGVQHVIDIRSFKVLASAVESRRASRCGIDYDRIPTGFFPTRKQTVSCVLSLLNRKPHGTIFFHCNLGSDRTGLIVALYRVNTLGWDPNEAFQSWKSTQFNTKLKDLDRYYWQHVTPTEVLTCH